MAEDDVLRSAATSSSSAATLANVHRIDLLGQGCTSRTGSTLRRTCHDSKRVISFSDASISASMSGVYACCATMFSTALAIACNQRRNVTAAGFHLICDSAFHTARLERMSDLQVAVLIVDHEEDVAQELKHVAVHGAAADAAEGAEQPAQDCPATIHATVNDHALANSPCTETALAQARHRSCRCARRRSDWRAPPAAAPGGAPRVPALALTLTPPSP